MSNWNSCRYRPGQRAGHYESYFVRANHPRRALAFWIRYTIFAPHGRPADAVGQLWAIYFDAERGQPVAVKQDFPLAACDLPADRLEMRIGAARLSESAVEGSARLGPRSLAWTLRYAGAEAPLLLLPASFYDRPFPKAKALVGVPNARFDGRLEVDGAVVEVDGWVGSQNHNWGSRHTDAYAWGQVAGFDGAPDVFLECATARWRIGALWTPWMTVLVLRVGGREYRLNGVLQAVRAAARLDGFDWHIDSRSGAARVSLRIHAPRAAFVGLAYENPPGGVKTCLNTKIAACELLLERPGHPAQRFVASHRAAFEILTERTDHGVAMLA